MDDTGSTRIGKLVFNHPFFIPGVLAIAISVALGFVAVSYTHLDVYKRQVLSGMIARALGYGAVFWSTAAIFFVAALFIYRSLVIPSES